MMDMLAICDIDHRYQLSNWERERIEANKEEARERKRRKMQGKGEGEKSTTEFFHIGEDGHGDETNSVEAPKEEESGGGGA